MTNQEMIEKLQLAIKSIVGYEFDTIDLINEVIKSLQERENKDIV